MKKEQSLTRTKGGVIPTTPAAESANLLAQLAQTNNSLMPISDHNSQATGNIENSSVDNCNNFLHNEAIDNNITDANFQNGSYITNNSTEVLLYFLELLKAKDALIEKLLNKLYAL